MKKFACITFLCACLSPTWAIEVTLDLHVSSDSNTTTVSVKTNLPPKTHFMASMINPIDQGGEGGMWGSKADVQNNHVVRFESFAKNGKRLSPGIYVLHISTPSVSLQPKEVQSAFGVKGERLTGPNVEWYAAENIVNRTYRFKLNPDGSITPAPAAPEKWNSSTTNERKLKDVKANYRAVCEGMADYAATIMGMRQDNLDFTWVITAIEKRSGGPEFEHIVIDAYEVPFLHRREPATMDVIRGF